MKEDRIEQAMSEAPHNPAEKAHPAIIPEAPRPAAEEAGAGAEGGCEPLDPTRYGDWEKNGRCIDF